MKLSVALLILTLSSIACAQGFSNLINHKNDTISANGEEQSIIKDYRKYVVDESITSITQIKLNDSFDNPWAIEFLNDDLVVVTEKNGTLSLVNLQLGTVTSINHEIPSVQYGQGGLLDVVKHEDYLYVSFAMMNDEKKVTTAIGRGLFIHPFKELQDFELLFTALPFFSDSKHFGSRIVIKNDYLFASIGERGQGSISQDLKSHAGSIIRINLDGSVPQNPYSDGADSLSEIFQIGVRNPQGMAISSNGDIFISNHGAKGGDFIGLITPGGNYGWDEIGWGGKHYIGFKIGKGEPFSNEFDMPILSWVPSIAPSDIVFYHGDEFPEWNNDLLVTSLKFKMLIKLRIEDGKVADELIILNNKIGRIRDVDVNSKGEIFLIADEQNSGIWKLNKKS